MSLGCGIGTAASAYGCQVIRSGGGEGVLAEVLHNHTPGGAHDYENKPPGGAGRSAKGDTGTTGTAVGTWMGERGRKEDKGGKRGREGREGLRDRKPEPSFFIHRTKGRQRKQTQASGAAKLQRTERQGRG